MSQPEIYEMDDRELELVKKLIEGIRPVLNHATGRFFAACELNNLDHRVAASVFALFQITSLLRLMAISSGMPDEEIDMKVITPMAHELHQHMANLMNGFMQKVNSSIHEGN